MTPTPRILEAVYNLICSLPPVCNWKMPKSKDVVFVVKDRLFIDDEKTEECYALYTSDGLTHEISVSKEKNKTFEEILTSMLHECIHLRRSGKSSKWELHDAVFKKYAKLICEEYGITRIDF